MTIATMTAAATISLRADRATLRRVDIGLGVRRVHVYRIERRHSERLLQQHRGRERIDVALPTPRAAPHVVDRAQGGRRGVPFVEQRHRQLRASCELGGHAPALGGAWSVLTL